MKSESAYRTITEVAELLQVQPSVLRFWETQFKQIKPLKRMGRRYYQAEDVVLLARIRDYLYKDFLTIKGVQKRLKSGEEDIIPRSDTPEQKAQDSFIQEIIDNNWMDNSKFESYYNAFLHNYQGLTATSSNVTESLPSFNLQEESNLSVDWNLTVSIYLSTKVNTFNSSK